MTKKECRRRGKKNEDPVEYIGCLTDLGYV